MADSQARRTTVLLLGTEVSDFTRRIAAALREAGATVDALELRGMPEPRKAWFDRVLPVPSVDLKHFERGTVVRALTRGGLARGLLRALASGEGPLRERAKDGLRERLLAEQVRPLLAGYDIVNVHSLDRSVLRLLPHVASGSKLVVSFWGSDLFRASPALWSAQRRVLERADAITMHSVEMREVVLAKFGRHLLDKTHIVLLGVDDALVDAMAARGREQARAEFCARHGLADDALVMALGYNASTEQNHLPAIEQITALPAALRARIALLVPMTYGPAPASYVEEVERNANAAGLARVIVLREFLPKGELVDLRLACDVVLHLLDSDAMSASLVEALWAGSVVIVGSWLPYGRLRSNGVYFREISRHDELHALLSEVCEQLPEQRALAAGNRERVRFTFAASQAPLWRDILLSSRVEARA